MPDTVLTGTASNDSLAGTSGSDVINSGAGDDTLDGSAGSDSVRGGSGGDVLIYTLHENSGSTDLYNGGAGIDTVRIVLNEQEFTSAVWTSEWARYLVYRESVSTDPETGEVSNGEASDFTFDFGNGTTLTVSMIEHVEYVVNAGPELTGDVATLAPAYEGVAYTITVAELLQGYSDAEGDALSVVGLAADHGTLTDNHDGTWTLVSEDLNGTIYLTYQVSDGFGNTIEVNQSVVVEAVADKPTLSVVVAGTEDGAIALQISAGLADQDGSESLVILVKGIPSGWTLSSGEWDTGSQAWVLDASELGSLVLTPTSGFEGNITLTVIASAVEASNGSTASVTSVHQVTVSSGGTESHEVTTIEGSAIDGYVAGATVFADTDEDGVLDAGEASATTDGSGNFTLVGGSGPLVMFGGTDVSTGLAFDGVLRAPEGATVVTPLTTLIAAQLELNPSLSVEDATTNVSTAFGLDPGILLLTFDPVAAVAAGGPDASAAAQVLAAGIQVENAIEQISALLIGAGAGNATDSVLQELASLVSGGTEVDLADSTTIVGLINAAAATAPGVDPVDIQAAVTDASLVLAETNSRIEQAVAGAVDTGTLDDLAQIAAVAQGDELNNALVLSGATNNPGPLVADYTGAALDSEIASATIGAAGGGLVGSDLDDTLSGGSENDAIDGRAGNDILYGYGGNDQLIGGAGSDALYGGDGTDRADYTGSPAGVSVNLGDGTATDGYGGSDALYEIEELRGSAFDDTLVGSAGPNYIDGGNGLDWIEAGEGSDTLSGGNGDDTFIPGGGDDQVDGGNGFDVVMFSGNRADYTITLQADSLTVSNTTGNGDGTDTLVDVERIQFIDDDFLQGGTGNDTLNGGSGNDVLQGGPGDDFLSGGDGDDFFPENQGAGGWWGQGNDSLDGGSGNDVMRGAPGNDTYNGGDGFDRVTYGIGQPHGVVVNLETGVSTDGFDNTDNFISIELISGTEFSDTITGANAVDELFYANAGNDIVDGGGGIDTASYYFAGMIIYPGYDSGPGVVVSLAGQNDANPDSNGLDGQDVLSNIENLEGSRFYDDILTGDGGPNVLTGLEGSDSLDGGLGDDTLYGDMAPNTNFDIENGVGDDDRLVGGGGNDILVGGAGNDSMTGGDGDDTFAWKQGDQRTGWIPEDTVGDFGANGGADRLSLTDLLVGENSSNLDDYLDFSSNGTDTTVTVRSHGVGAGVDQKIVLQGVDLTGGGTVGDTDIIAALIAGGKLITD